MLLKSTPEGKKDAAKPSKQASKGNESGEDKKGNKTSKSDDKKKEANSSGEGKKKGKSNKSVEESGEEKSKQGTYSTNILRATFTHADPKRAKI
jgi:hypothetical protein